MLMSGDCECNMFLILFLTLATCAAVSILMTWFVADKPVDHGNDNHGWEGETDEVKPNIELDILNRRKKGSDVSVSGGRSM